MKIKSTNMIKQIDIKGLGTFEEYKAFKFPDSSIKVELQCRSKG